MRINLRYDVPVDPIAIVQSAEEWLRSDSPDIQIERTSSADSELLTGTLVSDVTEIRTSFLATVNGTGSDLVVRLHMRGLGLRGKLHQAATLPMRGIVRRHLEAQMSEFLAQFAAGER